VEVFSRNVTDDGAGGQTSAGKWTSIGNIYALIIEAPANENLDRDALETQRGVSFITNYRTDIVAKSRLELDGNTFNVVSVMRVDKDNKASYRGEYLRIGTDTSVWYSV
jgi:SPP1 family predicted phage head-tail adaptor